MATQLPWEDTKEAIRNKAKKLFDTGTGTITSVSFEEFWNGVLQRGVWANTAQKGPEKIDTIQVFPTQIVNPIYN